MSQFELVVMGFGAHFIDLHIDGIIAEVIMPNTKLPKCVWDCVEPIWLVLGSLDTHVHMASGQVAEERVQRMLLWS